MADYTEDQLFAKLERADAAGDAEAAKVIADEIRRIRSAKPDFSNVTTKVTPGRGASIVAPKRGPVPRTRAELDRVTGTSTRGPSVMGAIGGSVRDFADSARQGFMRPFHGAAELLQTGTTSALEYAADTAPSTITRGLARLSRDTLESDRQALQQWEADYQARRGGANSTAGELVGGALPFAVGAPARAGTALMSRIAPSGSGLLRQGAAAGTVGGIGGAVAGLADPVQNYDNYVEQKAGNTALGGAAGAALAPLAGYAPAAFRGIADRFSGPRGSDRRMVKRLLEQAGGPVQVQESQVPGVRRTLDEATDNQGIMAYGRNLRRLYPQEFADQDMANNAARYRTLEGIAGDDDAMEAASALRNEAAGPLYQQAGQAVVPVTDELGGVLSRIPNNIMSSARRLARIEGNQIAESPGSMTGQQLHYIKLAIDNALSGQGGGSLGNVERALLMQVKDDLVGNVSSVIPAYGDAMAAYRGASGPIGRMQIGRRIMERADSSRVDPSGVPILSPFQYAKNTRNLDRVAQDATGFNKAKAANILSPEDIRNISAIGDDMQRIMRRQSNPAQPGSATMEASDIAKRVARQGLGGSLGKGLPVVEGLADYFAKRRESKDLQTLFELYRNPQRAQQVMSQLSKKDRAKLNATLSMLAVGIQANNQEGQ